MVKNSNALHQNEIHRADSPSNEDSNDIIFLLESFRRRYDRKILENGQNQGNLLYKLGRGQF